jgi:hypothetical protein
LDRALTGHDCVSVQKIGWGGGIKNGKLLALAQEQFEIFLTADRNLSFQQNTTQFRIAVVLVAGSTQLNKTMPLMPQVLALLPALIPGQVAIVS